MPFNVKNEYGDVVEIYGTRGVKLPEYEKEFVEFLIYNGWRWAWVSADSFEPVTQS